MPQFSELAAREVSSLDITTRMWPDIRGAGTEMELATTESTAAPTTPLEGLPPGPDWSLLRSTLQWWRRPLQTLEECQARYGDMFTYRLAHEGTWVFVSHPDAIKQVFTGDPHLLRAGEANIVLLPLLGEHSVLLLDEPEHMVQRKLMLPPFHGKRMHAYRDVMARVAAEEIERWPTDEPVRMRPRMQAVTLEVILRAVFGVAEGDHLTRLRDELRHALGLLAERRRAILLMALGPKRIRKFPPFRRLIDEIDVLLYPEIEARRMATDLAERDDILSLLLQARHEDGRPMNDRELRDELMTLLVAGHETTATALSWAIELLARHPEELERLEADLANAGDQYLDAVIKETLRVRPVVSLVLRKLVEPMEIGGRLLPAGVSVAPSIYLVHRRPDVYTEPERFRPERFLEKPAGTYTWIPFGGGVRRCLGGAFAEFEMAVVLRELVTRRRIRPVGGKPEHPVRRTITNVPSRGGEVLAPPR
jgi:cytochrome P450 family 135